MIDPPLSFPSTRPLLIIVLLGFWLFMAHRAYARGDVNMAVVLVVVGSGLWKAAAHA
jgi:hypothetical protein